MKQDLSSFRYEVLNHLNTQKDALQQAISNLSTKLDMLNSLVSGHPDLMRPGENYCGPQILRTSPSRDSVGVPVENGGRKASRPSSETDSVIHGDVYEEGWVYWDGYSPRASPEAVVIPEDVTYAMPAPAEAAKDCHRTLSDKTSNRKSRSTHDKRFSRPDSDIGGPSSSIGSGSVQLHGSLPSSDRETLGPHLRISSPGNNSPEKEGCPQAASQPHPGYSAEDLEQFVDILGKHP